MAYQLETQELRRRVQRLLDNRARRTPSGIPDPSADLTLLEIGRAHV